MKIESNFISYTRLGGGLKLIFGFLLS